MKNLRLRAARAAKGLSQQGLADLAGVSRQTINAIEKGDYNPTIRLCIAICRALDRMPAGDRRRLCRCLCALFAADAAVSALLPNGGPGVSFPP